MLRAIRGTLVDTPAFGEIRVREDTLLVLRGPEIQAIQAGSAEAATLHAHGLQPADVLRLKVVHPSIWALVQGCRRGWLTACVLPCRGANSSCLDSLTSMCMPRSTATRARPQVSTSMVQCSTVPRCGPLVTCSACRQAPHGVVGPLHLPQGEAARGQGGGRGRVPPAAQAAAVPWHHNSAVLWQPAPGGLRGPSGRC